MKIKRLLILTGIAISLFAFSDCSMDLLGLIREEVQAYNLGVPAIAVYKGTKLIDNDGSYDAGTVIVGDTVNLTIIIENPGTGTLELTGSRVELSTSYPGDFTITALPLATVGPGNQQVFTMEISPSVAGTLDATVSIFCNAEPATYTFTVTVSTTGPVLSVEDGVVSIDEYSTYDIGSTTSGTPLDIDLRLYNRGTPGTFLSIPSPSVSISNPATARISVLTDPGPASVSVDAYTTLTLRYVPINQLQHTNTVYINHSSGQIFEFDVTGTMLAPDIEVEDEFGSVLLSGSGTYSFPEDVKADGDEGDIVGSDKTFTVKNVGTDDLVVSSISLGSDTHFDMTESIATIASGSSEDFTIRFDPTTIGSKSTQVTINSNDLDEGNYTFQIQGNGTKPPYLYYSSFDGGPVVRDFMYGGNPISVASPPGAWGNQVALDINNNRMFVAVSQANQVFCYDLATGELLDQYPMQYAVGASYDPNTGYLYTSSWQTGQIVIIDTATGGQMVINMLQYARHVALDLDNSKLYCSSMSMGLYRFNLDGSGMEIIDGSPQIYGIAVDSNAAKIYYVDMMGPGNIYRADLDGGSKEILFTDPGGGNLGAIGIDTDAGKVYWTNESQGKIKRANLDGSALEEIATGFYSRGLAIDLSE